MTIKQDDDLWTIDHIANQERPNKVKKAVRQQTVFDVQWSDCPQYVEEEVKQLWRDEDFGNKIYFYLWNDANDAKKYPIIAAYLKSKGAEGSVWIRWWW